MTYRFIQYSSQRQGLIIQPFRSSRLILHSRRLDQTQTLTFIPLTCSDPSDSWHLRAELRLSVAEQFQMRSSHSSQGQNCIAPSSAVRLPTCLWQELGPIQDGPPTSKAPSLVATGALMR